MCTFSPEKREAQGETHSRNAVIDPISQIRKRRPERVTHLRAIQELVRKLEDERTEWRPYYMPGLKRSPLRHYFTQFSQQSYQEGTAPCCSQVEQRLKRRVELVLVA